MEQHNREQDRKERADQLSNNESWNVINGDSCKGRGEAPRKSDGGVGERRRGRLCSRSDRDRFGALPWLVERKPSDPTSL
jgi:hypothetical protein